jgi:hypothetical protein
VYGGRGGGWGRIWVPKTYKRGWGGVNIRLMRVEECSLIIEGRHNFIDTG